MGQGGADITTRGGGNRPETESRDRDLKKRRTRRTRFIWLLIAVFVAGNLWDLLGGHSWGPAQSTDQAVWVHASAALFWLALGMLALCLRDLASLAIRGSRPPTIEDLPDDDSWWDHWIANPTRRFAVRYRALVGVIGLLGGAVFGHFAWKP